jgi:hypothetical protein
MACGEPPDDPGGELRMLVKACTPTRVKKDEPEPTDEGTGASTLDNLLWGIRQLFGSNRTRCQSGSQPNRMDRTGERSKGDSQWKRCPQSIVRARPEERGCDGTDARNGWADRSGLLDWNGCSRTCSVPVGKLEESRLKAGAHLSRVLRVA